MHPLDHLTLPEQLLLLCWNDRSGAPRTAASTGLNTGIGGAILLELTLRDQLTLGPRQRPTVDRRRTRDPVLDEAIDRISRGPARRTLKGWVRNLGTGARRNQVRDRLVAQRVLRGEQRNLLGIFPVTRYVPVKPAQLGAFRDHVGRLLTSDTEVDERDASLLALVGACGAVDVLVPRPQRRAARRRAQELAAAHPGASATGAVVQETQAAIIAAIGASATTAASSSN